MFTHDGNDLYGQGEAGQEATDCFCVDISCIILNGEENDTGTQRSSSSPRTEIPAGKSSGLMFLKTLMMSTLNAIFVCVTAY